MRKAWLEVVLHRPEGIESYFLSEFHLSEHLVKHFIFAVAVFKRARYLNLVENAKVHNNLPLLSPFLSHT